MKESKLIEMQNKIEALGSVVQRLAQEINSLQTLFMGVHETQKLMPGFDEAIKILKDKHGKEQTDTE